MLMANNVLANKQGAWCHCSEGPSRASAECVVQCGAEAERTYESNTGQLKDGEGGNFYIFPYILKSFLYVLSQYSMGLNSTDKSQLAWV